MNSGEKIVLRISGPIPSFKNRKRAILDRNTGKMRTLTDPAVKKRMEEIIYNFVCQLNSRILAIAGETLTVQQAQSLIVSLVPEDDSWQWIPELNISATKGNDGATITIEAL